jgi:DNA modification methylase
MDQTTTATDRLTIINADALTALKTLPDNSVQCCVTSPPYYGLRNYGVEGQIGAEKTPEQYIASLVEVFREVRRVLREDGVLWLNLGDSYTSGGRKTRAPDVKDSKGARESDTRPDTPQGLKPKDLLMIPARVALALQADGWYLRSSCPWIKRNAMPESVKDRPATTIETIFMLTKSAKYHYDAEAVKIAAANAGKTVSLGDKSFSKGQANGAGVAASGNGLKDAYTVKAMRSRRSSDWFIESWQGLLQDEDGDPLAFVVNTRPYRGAHFAVFPPDLVRPCIQASVSEHGCCGKCGAPYERTFERTDVVDESAKGSRFDTGKTGDRTGGERTQKGERYLLKQTGWKPSCECGDREVARCTVLDPFGGSGTTAAVALELGCNAILVELNADYIPLIRERCAAA